MEISLNDTPDRWLRLSIPLQDIDAEILIARLDQLGALGITETGEQLEAYFLPDKSEQICGGLQDFLQRSGHGGEFSRDIIPRENWHLNWQDYFRPMRISDKILIYPYWETNVETAPVSIAIKPGMAFGTGTHATTQMALQLMQNYLQQDMLVLDAGCGNGILSMAALKLGAGQIDSWDNDPDIEDNYREEMELNRIRDRFTLQIGDVTQLNCYPFDLILSNIQFVPNLALLAAIHRSGSKSVVIFTGILTSQGDDFLKQIHDYNFRVLEQKTMDEWMAVVVKT